MPPRTGNDTAEKSRENTNTGENTETRPARTARFLTKKFATGAESPENTENTNTQVDSKKSAVPANRKFHSEWLDKFRWLRNVDGRSFCAACDKPLLNHLNGLHRHAKLAVHERNLQSKENQVKMDAFTKEKASHNRNVQNAEYALIMFLVMHNLPFILMDFLPNLLRVFCLDSKIAKDIKCVRTKAAQLTKELGIQ
ncbi:hypothetical protein ACLKA6_018229 [Drosophila palustris]